MPGGTSSTSRQSGLQSGTTTPVLNPNLQALLERSLYSARGLADASGNLIGGQLNPSPMGVAGLTPDEQSLIARIEAEAGGQGGPAASELGAANNYLNEANNYFGQAGNYFNRAGQFIDPATGQLKSAGRQLNLAGGALGPISGDISNAQQILAGLGGGATAQDIANAEAATANIGGTQSTADIASSRQLLDQLTSGPIGSSPATAAAMRAYKSSAVPQILSGQAMAGPGRGGGLAEALQQGEEQAYVPLVQQEISNRLAAAPQYAGLGAEESELAQARAAGYTNLADYRNALDEAKFAGNQALAGMRENLAGAREGLAGAREGLASGYGNLSTLTSNIGREMAGLGSAKAGLSGEAENLASSYENLGNYQQQQLAQALAAAGVPRGIQDQIFQNQYQDMLRRYGLEQETALGPEEQLANLLAGTRTTGTTTDRGTQTPSLLDFLVG